VRHQDGLSFSRSAGTEIPKDRPDGRHDPKRTRGHDMRTVCIKATDLAHSLLLSHLRPAKSLSKTTRRPSDVLFALLGVQKFDVSDLMSCRPSPQENAARISSMSKLYISSQNTCSPLLTYRKVFHALTMLICAPKFKSLYRPCMMYKLRNANAAWKFSPPLYSSRKPIHCYHMRFAAH
jgi:hypothetical protein